MALDENKRELPHILFKNVQYLVHVKKKKNTLLLFTRPPVISKPE